MPDMDTVTGTVRNVIFANHDSLFKIVAVDITATTLVWTEPEIVVKGNLGDLQEGTEYEFSGRLVAHPKYGQQFDAVSYQSQRPTSHDGLVDYLASDRFPGIGPKTAAKIVDALGIGAVDSIVKDPGVLTKVGLSEKKAAALADALRENLGLEQVIIGLGEVGLTGALANKVYSRYREDALDIVRENPYQLIVDIEGIGFRVADSIARQMDVAPDDPRRLGGAILDVLYQMTDRDGDTYAEPARLLDGAKSRLAGGGLGGVADEQLMAAVQVLADDRRISVTDGRIFPKRLFDAEWQIANHLFALNNHEDGYDDDDLTATLKQVEGDLDIEYDDTQRSAVIDALQNHVFLLTGGPGTGKTTVVNGIVRAYAQLNDVRLDPNSYDSETAFPIMLAAPTGRAAKRMAETTGLPASTIHRLLGLSIDTVDYDPPELPDGLLIVDEMSMVDTYLFRILLDAVHPGITLIMVGDKDQLPSVGPGQVFADLLASHVLAQAELTHIHRQDAQSSITTLAHDINGGRLPADFGAKQADRSFINCGPGQIQEAVRQVATAAKGKFGPLQVQVLAPMYRGVAGVDALNPLVQDIFNPKKSDRTKEIDAGDHLYRIGDKVLQLVNNPEKNVYNGEIGIVTGIQPATKDDGAHLIVDYDGNEIDYAHNELKSITLAYATSIHKAQGSEFDMVILPLTMASRRMLKRNLVYTAITRAKKFLIMIGELEAFDVAVKTMADNRRTGLVDRLCKVFKLAQPETDNDAEAETVATTASPQEAVSPSPAADQVLHEEPAPSIEAPINTEGPTVLTPTLVTHEQVDPMIGMDGITPQTA
ncbi:SF1B family DNA helicase RecD2 [Lacticaseibacillus pantheris]|uniref:SF1B family DNA helicase RecD2 n=1 Tax=Lacticaseibacillus pantheris TaxID=171523 RepID=UPI003F517855